MDLTADSVGQCGWHRLVRGLWQRPGPGNTVMRKMLL